MVFGVVNIFRDYKIRFGAAVVVARFFNDDSYRSNILGALEKSNIAHVPVYALVEEYEEYFFNMKCRENAGHTCNHQ
jgi:hypothetical protein